MKTLPKYWVIEKNALNPLWIKFREWFSEVSWFPRELHCQYYTKDGSEGYNWFDFSNDRGRFINNPALITLEEWDSIVNWTKQNKNLTYETQYLRSDWTLFTKDSIDWKSIEDLKQEMKEAMWTVNKIRGLLKAHKNKFSN